MEVAMAEGSDQEIIFCEFKTSLGGFRFRLLKTFSFNIRLDFTGKSQ